MLGPLGIKLFPLQRINRTTHSISNTDTKGSILELPEAAINPVVPTWPTSIGVEVNLLESYKKKSYPTFFDNRIGFEIYNN